VNAADGRMSARRHELLADLATQTEQLLRGFGVPAAAAASIGNELADHLAKRWGGQLINFPMDYRFQLANQQLEMYDAFLAGASYGDVATRYGIGERQVRKIINAVRERIRDQARRAQLDLLVGPEEPSD